MYKLTLNIYKLTLNMDKIKLYEQLVKLQMGKQEPLFPTIENLHEVNMKIVGEIFTEGEKTGGVDNSTIEQEHKIVFFL